MKKHTIIKSKEASLVLVGHELVLAAQSLNKPRVTPLAYAVPASLMAEFVAAVVDDLIKQDYEAMSYLAGFDGVQVFKDEYVIRPNERNLLAIAGALHALKIIKCKPRVFRGKRFKDSFVPTSTLWALNGGEPVDELEEARKRLEAREAAI